MSAPRRQRFVAKLLVLGPREFAALLRRRDLKPRLYWVA